MQRGNEGQWELIEKTQLMYKKNGKAYLKNGLIIPIDQIESMADIDFGAFFEVIDNSEKVS